MNSMYKPLILAVVVGFFVYILGKTEYSGIIKFVIIYIVLTMVTLLFRKIEKKRVEEKKSKEKIPN